MRFKAGSIVLVLVFVWRRPAGCGSKKTASNAASSTTTTTAAATTNRRQQRRSSGSDSSEPAPAPARSTPTSFASVKNCAQLESVGEKFSQAMAAAAASGRRPSPTSRRRTNRLANAAPSAIRSNFETIATAFQNYANAVEEGGLHARQGSHRVADRGARRAVEVVLGCRTSRPPSSTSPPGRARTARMTIARDGVDQAGKAAAFRRMHLEPPLLVLPNAWDVASAKAFASVPGCRALATTSSAVARSLGWEDGERAPRDEMVEAARRIAAAVDLPGVRRSRARLRRSRRHGARRLGGGPRRDQLRGLDPRPGSCRSTSRRRRSRAIREAVPELVVNARVDVFLRGGGRRRGGRACERVPRRRRRLRLSDPLPARLDLRARAPDRRADQRDRRRRACPAPPSCRSSASPA